MDGLTLAGFTIWKVIGEWSKAERGYLLKEIVTGDKTCPWGLYLALACTHALPSASCLPGSETESLCQALMATVFCSKTSLETERRDPD